jgi:hypothetical protein
MTQKNVVLEGREPGEGSACSIPLALAGLYKPLDESYGAPDLHAEAETRIRHF